MEHILDELSETIPIVLVGGIFVAILVCLIKFVAAI